LFAIIEACENAGHPRKLNLSGPFHFSPFSHIVSLLRVYSLARRQFLVDVPIMKQYQRLVCFESQGSKFFAELPAGSTALPPLGYSIEANSNLDDFMNDEKTATVVIEKV